MFTMDDKELATDLDLDEDGVIQEDAFERDPNDEDSEGYVRNAGASATHYYRDSCIMLIPRACRMGFVFTPGEQGKTKTRVWIDTLVEQIANSVSQKKVATDLQGLCERIIASTREPSEFATGSKRKLSWDTLVGGFSDTALGDVVRAALKLRNLTLLLEVAGAVRDMQPLYIFKELG